MVPMVDGSSLSWWLEARCLKFCWRVRWQVSINAIRITIRLEPLRGCNHCPNEGFAEYVIAVEQQRLGMPQAREHEMSFPEACAE